jgi:phytoene desaturase
MSDKPRAAVIGAGFGGLALAVRLQAGGYQTTLLEKRDKPGGRAYVYQEAGYTFDGGPTVITDPSALAELFTLAGRDMADYVELRPVEPMYRLVWDDGDRFDYTNDEAALAEQIAARSQRDLDGYRAFLDYSRRTFQAGYRKLGAVPFLHLGDMVRVVPQLARLQAYRSVYGMVAHFVKDEHLRQALSFHPLLIGGHPFRTSAIYTLIHALEREWGVWFPRGGTGALVDGLRRLFEDLGGELRLNSEVSQLESEGGRITGLCTRDGWRGHFDAVASNADVVHTYRDLLAGSRRGAKEARRLQRKRFSMSLFVVYFGLDCPPPADLQHHTVLFGPRYRELIDDIFNGPELPEDFSLYLHAPSVSDDSLAPAGGSAYYALAPVPHLGSADVDWQREGPRLAERILARLEERLIPGLREHLVTQRLLTPDGFHDDLNAHLGSAFSIEPILTQSAWFRPHNRDDRIPNLYLVGAGTHPGAGVPGVVGSAKATAGLMLADAGLGAADG